MVEGSHSEAYVDKFEGMACPRWEQPSGCAIRLLREGKAEGVSANTTADNITEWDGNASTFQLTCNACALTVANDPYERSNIESIDSETGVAETAGGVLSKTGARRGREDAINRIDQLCEKLGFGSDINILAVNLFRAMYQAGVAKGGRGFKTLEVIAVQTAATNFSRSISLAEVIDSHRTWTTSSGQTKPVGEISLKSANRLQQKMYRQEVIPRPKPSATSLIRANKFVNDYLNAEIIERAQRYTQLQVDGRPEAIAAGALYLASLDLNRPQYEVIGRLSQATLARAFSISTTTVRRVVKRMRIASGVRTNPGHTSSRPKFLDGGEVRLLRDLRKTTL